MAPGGVAGASAAAAAPGRPEPAPPGARHCGQSRLWRTTSCSTACANGQTLKCLTVVDEWTRESLAIDVAGQTIRSGLSVIEVLTQLLSVHGAPRYLRSDNGARVCRGCDSPVAAPGADRNRAHRAGEAVAECDRRIVQREVPRRVSEPAVRFGTAWTRRSGIEQWRRALQRSVRPHSSLGYLTPAEFKAQLRAGSDERWALAGDAGKGSHADQEVHESDFNYADWRCSPVIGGPKKAVRSGAVCEFGTAWLPAATCKGEGHNGMSRWIGPTRMSFPSGD